jgi:hypothetical protein
MTTDREYRLLVLHRTGWSAYGHSAPNCTFSTSGYGDPKPEDLARLLPGYRVVDEREVIERDPGAVFASPMVDTRLKGGECRRFSDLKGDREIRGTILDAFSAADPVGAAVASLAKVAEKAPQFSGMDLVSVGGYIAWWRARGARIGAVVGGSIRWED